MYVKMTQDQVVQDFVSTYGVHIEQKDISGSRRYIGVLHSTSAPAIQQNKTEFWYFLGEIHRDNDQPAVTQVDGTQFWFQYGKYHRDGDKPAIVYPNGRQEWYSNGVYHRDDGKPAVVDSKTGDQFWVNGVEQ